MSSATCSHSFESGVEANLYSKISSIYAVNDCQLPFIYLPKLSHTIIDSCLDFITSDRLLCGTLIRRYLPVSLLRYKVELRNGQGQPNIIPCLHHWSDINLQSPGEKILTGNEVLCVDIVRIWMNNSQTNENHCHMTWFDMNKDVISRRYFWSALHMWFSYITYIEYKGHASLIMAPFY